MHIGLDSPFILFKRNDMATKTILQMTNSSTVAENSLFRNFLTYALKQQRQYLFANVQSKKTYSMSKETGPLELI